MRARRLIAAALAMLFCALSLFGCREETDTTPCAGGHTPSEWIVLLAPTEQAEGKRQKICTVCGVTLEVESIERVAPAEPTPTQTTPAGSSAATASSALLEFVPLTNDTCAVCAGDGAAGATAITIPAAHEGRVVTEIAANGFSACAALQSVTLPDTIAKIGARAFSGCAALTEINLPASLVSVGEGAFAGCTQLSATAQGYGRYLGDAGAPLCLLLTVTDPTVDYFAPAHGPALIADDALSDCSLLTDLLLPTTLRAVGGSLAACGSLQSIFTDMTAAEWAAIYGADDLPAGATVYTYDEWHYIHGKPTPN